MLKRIALAALVLVFATAPAAASDDLWLHVFVQEDGEKGETVRVNVPISLVQQVLPLIENEHIRGGKVLIPEQAEIEGIDFRGILEAVRETADGEFVTVQGQAESVLVAKKDGMLVVDVDDDDEKVRVRLPLEVLEAAFSGEADEVDIVAALRVLGETYPQHDVVTVEDGSTLVRVWIDRLQEMNP